MARTPVYDPLTSEARSPWLAGLTDACNKLSGALEMKTSSFIDLPMNEVFISDTDRYRIYQVPVGNKLWLNDPAPVIRKNGVVITPATDNFTIDLLGGSIVFERGSTLTADDTVTADATFVDNGSNVLDEVMERLGEVSETAGNFKGYFTTYENMIGALGTGIPGQFAIVGGDENTIYIWNSTIKRWVDIYRTPDLSDYYTKEQTDELVDGKEDYISPKGETAESDDYYYGGRKQWVKLGDMVRDVILVGLSLDNSEEITDEDTTIVALGKLQAQINQYVHDLFGSGAPTNDTEGQVGQDYTNTSNGNKYHLISAENANYIWKQYADTVIPTVAGNIAILNADGQLEDSGKGVGDVGKMPVPIVKTLPVANWQKSDDIYTQTVFVEGILEDETKQIIIVSPLPTQYNLEAAMNAGVYCSEQGEGTLTFVAYEDIPEYAITFNISIQNL